MLMQNRITELEDLPEAAAPKLTRAESARINGAKSRGPITPEGKKRSSQNSVKHGLLSRRIAPLIDDRGEQLDYEAYVAGFIEQYQPQTQTEVNLIELLARDWVRLGRIGGYTESLMKPDGREIRPMHFD